MCRKKRNNNGKAFLLIVAAFIGLSNGDWERIELPFDAKRVYFIDAQHGWLLSAGDLLNSNVLYNSSDSGKTWKLLGKSEDSGFYSGSRINQLYFFDKDNGWVIGSVAKSRYGILSLFKTSTGGKSWEHVLSDSSLSENSARSGDPFVPKLFFPTPLVGYFFGTCYESDKGNFTLMGKTTDGGATWTKKELLEIPQFRDASFISADTGWIAEGATGRYYKTVDGGAIWDKVTFSPISYRREVTSVFFVNSKVGWFGGVGKGLYGSVVSTTDGGESWMMSYNEGSGEITYSQMLKMQFIDEKNGWVLTDNVSVLSTEDGGVSWEETSFNDVGASGIGRTGNFDMHFVDKYHGWVIMEWEPGTSTGVDPMKNAYFRTVTGGGSVSVKHSSPRGEIATSFKIKSSSVKNGSANIIYILNAESTLSLSVYNLKGKRVAFVPKQMQPAGEHRFSFKASKGFYIVEVRMQGKPGVRMFTERFFVR